MFPVTTADRQYALCCQSQRSFPATAFDLVTMVLNETYSPYSRMVRRPVRRSIILTVASPWTLASHTRLAHLILSFSVVLSSIILFTNWTSPPGKMLSVGLAVLTLRGSGRFSLREENVPHASRLLAKNGGLHIQKVYESSLVARRSNKLESGSTFTTV